MSSWNLYVRGGAHAIKQVLSRDNCISSSEGEAVKAHFLVLSILLSSTQPLLHPLLPPKMSTTKEYDSMTEEERTAFDAAARKREAEEQAST